LALDEFAWTKYGESKFIHKTLLIQDFSNQNIKYFSKCFDFIKTKIIFIKKLGNFDLFLILLIYLIINTTINLKDI